MLFIGPFAVLLFRVFEEPLAELADRRIVRGAGRRRFLGISFLDELLEPLPGLDRFRFHHVTAIDRLATAILAVRAAVGPPGIADVVPMWFQRAWHRLFLATTRTIYQLFVGNLGRKAEVSAESYPELRLSLHGFVVAFYPGKQAFYRHRMGSIILHYREM